MYYSPHLSKVVTMHKYAIAAIGDVSKVKTFSGTPYCFYNAFVNAFTDTQPWAVEPEALNFKRLMWNASQVVRGRRPGGFQYSLTFHNGLLQQIPAELQNRRVISFNQHFPLPSTIRQSGGEVYYYIDATFRQLLDRYEFNRVVTDKRTQREIIEQETLNFQGAAKVVAFQHWAAESVIQDYGIDADKVQVILPGANLIVSADFQPNMEWPSGLGTIQPLVLGFVGKEWKRKGLPILMKVRDELASRGYKVKIKCAGYAPSDWTTREGVEFVGFIDKAKNPDEFMSFLQSCHLGCLFSSAECSSISVLEFIRAGVPVAGYIVDGMGDLYHPSVSLRFDPTTSAGGITQRIAEWIEDADEQRRMKNATVQYSNHVTWERAVTEWMQILKV